MLTALVAPATQNLMDPETVLARLGLAESELANLELQVAEASAMVARYLRFRPEYTTWRETFTGVSGDRLYLGARPAWSVQSVTYRDGAAQVADTYRLERGPHGESAIVRHGNPWGVYSGWPANPWGVYSGWPASGWIESPGLVLSSSPVLPDWSVDYTAGWWLPEMTGAPPAGVERFPADLERDFLKIVRWLRLTEGGLGTLASLGVSKTTNEGASMEFFSAKEQGTDAETGIPCSCTTSLALYRRVG